MLDREGYRPNVGIILVNARNEVFWGTHSRTFLAVPARWHQAQGESPEQAMYRELFEEVGLRPEHVKILGRTRGWLRYDVPKTGSGASGAIRIGAETDLVSAQTGGRDNDVCLRASSHPEFDAWRWSDYWVPLEAVIEFKRQVYQLALTELARIVFRGSAVGIFQRVP